MATQQIILLPEDGYPSDDTAGSKAALLQKRTTSDATDPQVFWYELLFDPDTDWHWYWKHIMLSDYVGSPVLKVYFKMKSATSNNVVFGCRIMAVTIGDEVDFDARKFDAANLQTVAVPGVAGYTALATITLANNDSLAANDEFIICVYRDADHGSDNAADNVELLGCILEYSDA